MKLSLLPLFLTAFIFTAISSNGQQQEMSAKAKKIYEKAEELYSHFDYYNAIDYYKQFLTLQKGNQESMLKIADSYYKIKAYDQTLAWYDSSVTKGNLPPAHELQYANVLMNNGMNDKAIVWLKKYIKSYPNDRRANEKLNGLENVEQFFTDHRHYTISNFSYNSKFSDFSPSFYKQGLVFVSDRGEPSNSAAPENQTNAYLDFYYVDLTDTLKKVPAKLKGMNNKFNEGPLTIYDNNKKMIFTRNDLVKKQGINGNSTLHFQMFYTESEDNGEWSKPALLSIHDKQYSMGHPTVSEDGKTLYFASNIPGGYGGSDIYKSRWENNVWGKPVNLGLEINSEGDEMFPYIFNDSILYFSSDGLRGLGGLDIFKYNLIHPAAVKNVGYPINSTKDDFGICYTKNGMEGYFSSNREGGVGSDDLYKFTIRLNLPNDEALAARVFKEEDQSPLPRAHVKVITFTESDLDLIANNEGIVDFYLPKGAGYILIGSKDDYIGMYGNTVMEHEDKALLIHPIATNNGHKDQISVVGRVLNTRSELLTKANVTVTDLSTNEKISAQLKDGLFSFYGYKGKNYTIMAEEENYQSASVRADIPVSATEVKKISITLHDKVSSSTPLATRVFKALDQSPLGGAHVSVIIFSDTDLELTANAEGVAEFNLSVGSPYVIIGSMNDYAGMYANVVKQGENKSNMVYPVSATNGHENQVAVVGRILNTKGDLIPQATGTVIDQSTLEKISAQFNEGLFSFFGLLGKSYKITADAKDYQSATAQVSIPPNSTSIEKISITLADKPSSAATLATRVFKEIDQSPLSGSHVSVISFSQADQELTANAEGIAEFNLPVGSPYVIIASLDDYAGMYSNIVMQGENKSNIVYPVSVTNGHENQVAVVGRIVNTKGELLSQASVIVIDQSTSEKIPVHCREGLFSFYSGKGKKYTLTADDADYQSSSVEASIASDATAAEKISITLIENVSSPSATLATRVFKEIDQSPLSGAHVSIISFSQADLELTANAEGIAEFNLPVGSPYVIIGNKDDYIGMYANVVMKDENKSNIVYPVSTTNEQKNPIAVVGRIMNKRGDLLLHASVTIADQSNNEKITAQCKDGLFNFYGYRAKNYMVKADDKDYQSTSVRVRIHPNAIGVEKVSITLRDKMSSSAVLAARVFKEADQSPLSGARVSIINFLQNDVELTANAEGEVEFNLPAGSPYVIIGKKDDYIGMYANTVMPGENKGTIVYPVSATNAHENQVPVVGRIFNERGEFMAQANGMVIDNTGLEVSVENKNGIFYFFGDRGKSYRMLATAMSYDMQEKNIHIDSLASATYTVNFNLVPAKHDDAEDATIIILHNDGTPKFYLTNAESLDAVIEKGDSLYLQNAQRMRVLGKGSLAEFGKDPAKALLQYGLTTSHVFNIQSIYFDYNKAVLNEADKVELDKVKDMLQRYPLLTLYISSHADVRGADSYNLNLSMRRSEAIRTYLINQKIDIKHVVINSFGESDPIVSCVDCSEEEHQKNRRAEFSLTAKATVPRNEKLAMDDKPVQAVDSHAQLLEKYGEREVEGLTFKIAVGAYRYNHGLTFNELKDLGVIEKKLINGVMYYYVTDFRTLKAAEGVRLEVKSRGVGDAFTAIFYKGKKVSFSKFISLLN